MFVQMQNVDSLIVVFQRNVEECLQVGTQNTIGLFSLNLHG